MREMTHSLLGFQFYESSFNPEDGTLVRSYENGDLHNIIRRKKGASREEYNDAVKRRGGAPRRFSEAFSPVPETIDVQITNRCGFGCEYCYMDSTPKAEHGPKDLVKTIIEGFDQPPYQMAIGGGEPTTHPDFVEILETVKSYGVVPNYTTSGSRITDEVAGATNEFCGGVAMTYHAFKGFDWFERHYVELREKLSVQINVHLIADKDVVDNLDDLTDAIDNIGPSNIVLLAYYPDIGRAGYEGLMSKSTYHEKLPEAIGRALNEGHEIAFSEGMIPYFLSRPDIGVNTDFAAKSEGLFSCYIDMSGRMSHSSFEPPGESSDTVFDAGSQALWNRLRTPWGPSGGSCFGCKFNRECTTPDFNHYAICAFAKHNDGNPPQSTKKYFY